LQLELFRMLEGGYVGLALAYAAATLAGGFACVHLGTVATRRARVLR
jgi:fluoride ion exporter CrcB/FEX